MKTITALLPQQKSKQRVNIYLDGEFYCGIEKITALSNNLEVGLRISEEKLAEIISESEYTSAFDRASKYLAGAQHTKMQVIIYLKDKKYAGKIIAKVIDKLEEYGYIDDEGFAKSFIDAKKSSHGKRYIACQLKLKGVDEKIIEKVLDETDGEEDSAYEVAKKRLKNKQFDYETKIKCFRYLMSRGFDHDAAYSALERLERELDD